MARSFLSGDDDLAQFLLHIAEQIVHAVFKPARARSSLFLKVAVNASLAEPGGRSQVGQGGSRDPFFVKNRATLSIMNSRVLFDLLSRFSFIVLNIYRSVYFMSRQFPLHPGFRRKKGMPQAVQCLSNPSRLCFRKASLGTTRAGSGISGCLPAERPMPRS
jgi:hypothetical protein